MDAPYPFNTADHIDREVEAMLARHRLAAEQAARAGGNGAVRGDVKPWDRDAARQTLRDNLDRVVGYIGSDVRDIIDSCEVAAEHNPDGIVAAILDAMIDFAADTSVKEINAILTALPATTQGADVLGAGARARLLADLALEAKDWRHNSYTRVMLTEWHDRLAAATHEAGVDKTARVNVAVEHTFKSPTAPAGDGLGVLPITDEWLDYIGRWGGRCRECADHDGLCPKGLPCGREEAHAAIRHVLEAVNYGIAHGYLALAPDRPARDGEAS